MSDLQLVRNATSQIVEVFLVGTSGNGSTGVLFGDMNITFFELGTSGAAISGAPITNPSNDTYLSNGWKEVDPATKAGLYQWGIPNVLLQGTNSNIILVFDYVGAGTIRSVAYKIGLVATEPSLGVKLSLDGLDLISIEAYTLPEAIKLMASVTCGVTVGAETNKTIFKAIGNDAIERLGSTVDSSTGNRTEIDLSI